MKNIEKPSLFWFFTEGVRAIVEYFQGLIFITTFKYKKIGDSQPVLAVPGLLCTDFAMLLLRTFVKRLGFTAYGWELGRNLGDLNELRDINRLNERVDAIYQKHNQKITLIGWSMGGIYVRELAKQRPHLFSQIITMGSPFGDTLAPNYATWIFEKLTDTSRIDEKWRLQISNPAPIPTTAIYSKQDGIVPWQACLELFEDETHKNMEVKGSHWGMGTNPKVLQIVADKLVYS